ASAPGASALGGASAPANSAASSNSTSPSAFPWRRPPALAEPPPGGGPTAPVAPTAGAGATEKPSRAVLSVSELTRQMKNSLEARFSRVCVRGEISGFRAPNARGHLYFNLKDPDACIDVKVWATTAQRLKFKLRDGLEVIAEGAIDLYAPQGRYS